VVSLRHCCGYLARLFISIQDFIKGAKSEKKSEKINGTSIGILFFCLHVANYAISAYLQLRSVEPGFLIRMILVKN
jgi:uncharacterized protein (DUF2141 family)